jgi:hypothetical protein
MPTSALATIPSTYSERLSAVRRGLIDGQREIDRGWVHRYPWVSLAARSAMSRCLIIAGPNGAGKTTFAREHR